MGLLKKRKGSAKEIRAAEEAFFGYRTIYDLRQFSNGVDLAGGFPPVFFFLMLGSQIGANAAREIMEKLKPQSEALVDFIRSQPELPSWSPIQKYSEQVVTDVLSLLTAEAKEILSLHNSELLESARWGILLADSDPERIGEQPPVASGVTYEAQKLIIDYTAELDDEIQELIRQTKIWCLQHAFYITRAGFRLE